METQDKKRTKRNLIIFTVSVLGLAALEGIVERRTVPLDTDPGTSGLGQLLWIVSPFGVILMLGIGFWLHQRWKNFEHLRRRMSLVLTN